MNTEIWLHGTEVKFDEWRIPDEFQPHKNGMKSHSAIFFTTSSDYARDVSNGKGLLGRARLKPNANVLDMTRHEGMLSEQYRTQVMQKPMGRKNPQVIYSQHWRDGWRSGSIMKYAASSEAEFTVMQKKATLARNHRHTVEGVAAFNELQMLTRSVIEELVVSARELGFDAVIGNEIDTLHSNGPITYRIMFALNPACLTPPVWE